MVVGAPPSIGISQVKVSGAEMPTDTVSFDPTVRDPAKSTCRSADPAGAVIRKVTLHGQALPSMERLTSARINAQPPRGAARTTDVMVLGVAALVDSAAGGPPALATRSSALGA